MNFSVVRWLFETLYERRTRFHEGSKVKISIFFMILIFKFISPRRLKGNLLVREGLRGTIFTFQNRLKNFPLGQTRFQLGA